MVLRLFYTSVTSTVGLQKKQEHIKQVLSGYKLEYDMIDICAPENEEEKKFMRANAKSRKTGSVPLPPQIFNDDTYCGDYEDFQDAIEENTLKVLLKLEDQVSQATITLSVKPDEEQQQVQE